MWVKMNKNSITDADREAVIAEFKKGGNNGQRAISERLNISIAHVTATLNKYLDAKKPKL